MANRTDYALPGPLTDLASVSPQVLERISGAPAGICWPVHTLVIQPHDAKARRLPDDRFVENQVRPAASLIEAIEDVLTEAEGWDVIHISGHGLPGELLLETAKATRTS
jgi:hypothetical protein